MRSAKSSLRNSFFSWLSNNKNVNETPIEVRLAEIRAAMLASLGSCGDQQFPHLERRLRYASDIQGLWYARSDLMLAVSASQGEAQARAHIAAITALFGSLQPGGGHSRPSPLSLQ